MASTAVGALTYLGLGAVAGVVRCRAVATLGLPSAVFCSVPESLVPEALGYCIGVVMLLYAVVRVGENQSLLYGLGPLAVILKRDYER